MMSAALAVILGVIRLLTGFAVHYAIFDATRLLPSMRLTEELLWSYFAFVVPVRLVTWLVILLIMSYLARSPARPAVADRGQKSTRRWLGLAWVGGGTILSCLLDILMMGVEQSFGR